MKIYKFTMTYDDKPYTDAVNLPDDHTYTDEQIMEMMLNKFTMWKTRLENPSGITEEPPLPVEESTQTE
jgi:hypothetical protein